MSSDTIVRRFQSNDTASVIALCQQVLPSSQPWKEARGVLCRKMNQYDDLVFAMNPMSARVLSRNGFEVEGTMRNHFFRDSQPADALIFGLLREPLR